MKTTIDIPDALLAEARDRARAEGTTLRELVADGLRTVLDRGATTEPYRYEPVVFDGELGVRPGVDVTRWDEIRAAIYGDPA
jgi:Arc/MetJ family transcription regulator